MTTLCRRLAPNPGFQNAILTVIVGNAILTVIVDNAILIGLETSSPLSS